MQKDTYNINWDNNLIHNVIIGQMKDLNVNFIGQLPSRNINVIFAWEKSGQRIFTKGRTKGMPQKCPSLLLDPEPRSNTHSDSDVILFHIYASEFLPPSCR